MAPCETDRIFGLPLTEPPIIWGPIQSDHAIVIDLRDGSGTFNR